MDLNSVNNDPLNKIEPEQHDDEEPKPKLNPAMLTFSKTDPSTDYPL